MNRRKSKSFAYMALRCGHASWLADQIRSDIASGGGMQEARGWRLLGFSDATEPFPGLWHELAPTDGRHGWLANVATASRNHFDRNQFARHWYEHLLTATTPAEVYASFRLMLGCVDQRLALWIDRERMQSAPQATTILSYWSLEHQSLQKLITDADKDHKNRLFGLSIMRHTQAPWF